MGEQLDQYDIIRNQDEELHKFFRAGPAGIRTTQAFSQDCRWDTVDNDRVNGCIRNKENAISQEGGLAVLFGNLAEDGCIVKTAGVDESIWKFTGTAIVFESQEDAVAGILGGKVKEGHVVVIRYEGPKGGPGMQEMLYPTSYLKSMGLGKKMRFINGWSLLWRYIRLVYWTCFTRSCFWRCNRLSTRWRYYQH